MDAAGIGIVVFIVIFIVGGIIAGHYATKLSQKDADEMNKLQDKK